MHLCMYVCMYVRGAVLVPKPFLTGWSVGCTRKGAYRTPAAGWDPPVAPNPTHHPPIQHRMATPPDGTPPKGLPLPSSAGWQPRRMGSPSDGLPLPSSAGWQPRRMASPPEGVPLPSSAGWQPCRMGSPSDGLPLPASAEWQPCRMGSPPEGGKKVDSETGPGFGNSDSETFVVNLSSLRLAS